MSEKSNKKDTEKKETKESNKNNSEKENSEDKISNKDKKETSNKDNSDKKDIKKSENKKLDKKDNENTPEVKETNENKKLNNKETKNKKDNPEKQEIKKEKTKEELLKEQDKVLKKVLLIIIFSIFSIFIIYALISYSEKIQYKGFDFEEVHEGQLVFYKTVFPIQLVEGNIRDYRLFLRENPEKTKKVSFEGNFSLMPNMVLNMTEEFNCGGRGVVAIANFVNLFNALGVKVITDPNATCNNNGTYLYVNIESGEKTKIIQNNKTCYDIQINNCEILPGTERFILEALDKKFN